TMLNEYWDGASPIGWNVDDPTPVGKSVVALLSDWLPATTGSIVYVDGGASHNTWFPDNLLS
ncbi:MAG: SDR family oxidoreductase, partial [Gordonia sp. (in: high G+C Gram-positive bacteria)]|uniref:SDR family oxidoreductase n=1 Tax=Gordonia sp. (in: high G+C Gram-positive bacteria) TaxID=84139 RepID=UPI003BB74D6E